MGKRGIVLAALWAFWASGVFAQNYPNRPIRLIVPFAAGGGSDFVGRLIGQKLTDQMGQTVVVDNRPGAASLVGTQIAANAAPDGYTLLLADSGFTINIAFFKDPKYDALKSFDPVSVVAEAPYILVVNPGLPYAGSLKEFVAAAKAQPGKLAIGSAGSGSGTHMTGELFRLRAGINMIHVPYKSVGPAMSDVVAGQIQSTITTPAVSLPLVKAGRLKILAAAVPQRSKTLPDVPTFAEGGVPDVNVSNWYSIVTVGGTPKPVIKRLYDEVARALAAPDMAERLAVSGLEPGGNTPEQFRKKIEEELQRWARVIKDAGIRQE
ncbi:MAG TPA: tripartite tricarboxylate transporter substrate binding protein [Burkholderiales bacterium]|jgi:tripartite-type tricarboxylate transporter receptor subunit TctC|nr:tripartite tricarboxylate transporter substrate binding protein [Burkholderiales bacterium]